jgi:hypothetical protein
MPASFLTTDLTSLFKSSEFGEDCGSVFYDNRYIQGIFDDEDIDVTVGEGVAQIVSQPMLTCITSQLTNLVEGKTITIRGEVFKIKNWKNDGVGITELYLDRTGT